MPLTDVTKNTRPSLSKCNARVIEEVTEIRDGRGLGDLRQLNPEVTSWMIVLTGVVTVAVIGGSWVPKHRHHCSVGKREKCWIPAPPAGIRSLETRLRI